MNSHQFPKLGGGHYWCHYCNSIVFGTARHECDEMKAAMKNSFEVNISVQTPNPKPDAQEYHIKSIADLFTVAQQLDAAGRKKMMQELAQSMEQCIAILEADKGMKMIYEEFVFIND